MVALAAVLLASVTVAMSAAMKYPPRGAGRIVLGVLSIALTAGAAIGQVFLYRDLANVRVPPDEPFFYYLLVGELFLVAVATVWAAARDPYHRKSPSSDGGAGAP